MVQTNQSGCFRHAVTLHNREAESQPELFCLGVERRAAANKRPELQAERSMNVAKQPPLLPDRHGSGHVPSAQADQGNRLSS